MRVYPGPTTGRRGHGTLAGSVLLGSTLFLLQLWFWHARVRDFYFPSGDDFALLVHSTRVFHAHPGEWFTQGFEAYFRPYPDLAIAYSEFLRPVDNAALYLVSLVCGRNWSEYLLLNYLLVAAVSAVTYALAAGVLRLPPALTLLVTAATIASPAYSYHVLYRPAFAFDYLGALWTLLCLLSLVRGRFAPAWIFTLLAVFSKETAYFTAIAACLAYPLCHTAYRQGRETLRRGQILLRASAFPLPLLFVFLLRKLDFQHAAGVYVLSDLTPKGLLRNIVLGFTDWPYRFPGEQHIFERSPHNIGSLLLSVALWLLIGLAVLGLLRTRSREWESGSAAFPGVAQAIPATSLLFLLGSCCLPIGLGLVQRFGASTFPLLFLTLGALAANASGPMWTRWLAALSLCLITIVDINALRSGFSPGTLLRQRAEWALARSFTEQLAAAKQPVLFLLGDLTESLASPDAVTAFVGTRSQVVPVSSMAPGACPAPGMVAIRPIHGGYRADAALSPACGSYALLGTGRRPPDPGRTVVRNLPQAKIIYTSPQASEIPGTFAWQQVRIDLLPKVPRYAILAPDPQADIYRVLAVRDTPGSGEISPRPAP